MSKLGLRLDGEMPLAGMIAARPRVVVTRDAAALAALHEALGDRCLLIAGVTPSDAATWGDFWTGQADQDLDRALDLWWAAAGQAVAAAPFAYWMAFEGVSGETDAAAYTAFEAARVERLAEAGGRACIGNFATGHPDPLDPVWAEFLTACRAARRHGGLLGLQEFGALYMWTGYASNAWTGDGFRLERKFPPDHQIEADLCLHYRALYRLLLEPAGLGALPLVITACGLGRTADAITAALSVDGAPTGGWLSCGPTWRQRDGEQNAADFYLRQLLWYEAQIARDPSVIGAAVAGWGASDESNDGAVTGDLAELLLAAISAGPDPAASLHPEPVDLGLPPTVLALDAAPDTTEVDPPAGTPADDGQRYTIAVRHPEIFDALWQEGEPLAHEGRARLSWQEAGGLFVIQTDDKALWGRLYQYGQMLAQQIDTGIEAGTIDLADSEP